MSDTPRMDKAEAKSVPRNYRGSLSDWNIACLRNEGKRLERELAAERERRLAAEAAVSSKLLEDALEGNSSAAFKWSEKHAAAIERAKEEK